jgi:SAM-dependent methyltransferase
VLASQDASLRCAGCGAAYPLLAGIPWLLPAPQHALAQQRAESRALLSHLQGQAASYRDAVARSSRPATRTRLKLLAAACDDHARRLRALLAPLGLDAAAASPAIDTGLLGGPRNTPAGLTAYYANVHRDWVWGGEENTAALECVQQALGTEPAGRTLVVGAGAGRLAYDLHVARAPCETCAADINPLLLLVAQAMYSGASLELYEFPVAPRDAASHALLRRLTAPRAAPPGLTLVAADARQPALRSAAYDTVVTPWLVDVVDADLDQTVAAVNRLLRPGGRWICTGTLFFAGRAAEHSHASDEVREVAVEGGFRVGDWSERQVPYLASPASRHARLEQVVTFVATKEREAAPVRRDSTPDWALDPARPIPLLPAVAQRTLALRVEGYVASLVDGRRSLQDIAAQLAADRLLPADEALGLVRGFVLRLHEDAARPHVEGDFA